MADLYLENDVSLQVAPLLRRAGHHLTATRDLRLNLSSDDSQLLTAVQNNWILITYNRDDFTMLHNAWLTWPAAFGLRLPSHSSILVPDHAPSGTQANVVAGFLTDTSAERLRNQLFWWHRHDGWRHRAGTTWEALG